MINFWEEHKEDIKKDIEKQKYERNKHALERLKHLIAIDAAERMETDNEISLSFCRECEQTATITRAKKTQCLHCGYETEENLFK